MIWRKIKKMYFKIYHLFKLIGIFILVLIPSIVKAKTYNECWNQYKIGEVTSVQRETSSWSYLMNNGNKIEIPIQPGETKYIRYFPSSNTCTSSCVVKSFINSNGEYTNSASNLMTVDYENYILEIKAVTNDVVGFRLRAYTNNFAPLLLNTPIIVSENKSDLEECPTQPNNDVISEFTSVYTDRLSYLGTETMNNEYMLAFIGIIIGFIVLEIFLRIFHIRGGYKK